MATLFTRQAVASASRTARCWRPAAVKVAPVSRALPISQRMSFSQSVQRLEKRFTETHEWIDVASDGKTCTIGITKHAAEALGDIVYVELPEVGDEVGSGDSFGSVESVKSASDIVSPSTAASSPSTTPCPRRPQTSARTPRASSGSSRSRRPTWLPLMG
uniref:Lipoyl-binding domain-containing protein n=1 Tax=Bionectria ochroleuca TaxID=29856 RepID=A0A8H7KEH8_BIOOC